MSQFLRTISNIYFTTTYLVVFILCTTERSVLCLAMKGNKKNIIVDTSKKNTEGVPNIDASFVTMQYVLSWNLTL